MVSSQTSAPVERAPVHRPPVAGANGHPSRPAKAPGTPRKDAVAVVKEKAVQDPGLKDYRLGECLGKGAFGSVYKAFNWGTGEAVAIKQIKLGDLPKSELRMIEAEIDLLKNLHHDNIVKYLGFVKSVDCLNIILEFCENGSLHSICKTYGKFPENLVGVYMAQVLQGLLYLHDQGVIHRDIKGANILTTKDGKVKLADFGVSTSTLAGADKEAQVVGTPYWMAPEIIQLSGATPASDIWSLGCTVIELLDGKPPYYKLAPMPALFAIVNDDHPPLPEGVSPAARDFLSQCFQKDPNLRVSARKLLKHAWIVGTRRTDVPITKQPANFSEAVEEVKQWNEALKSPVGGGSFRASRASPPLHRREPQHRATHAEQQSSSFATPAKVPLALPKAVNPAEAFRSPDSAGDDNWDDDFATSISPSALQLPHLRPQDNFAGLFSAERLKTFASIDGIGHGEERDPGRPGDALGDPFDSHNGDGNELETIRPFRLNPRFVPTSTPKVVQQAQSSIPQRPRSPIKTQAEHKFVLPARPATLYREQSIEDYSDLFVENDDVFDQRLLSKEPTNSSNPSRTSQAASTSRRARRSLGRSKAHSRTTSDMTDDEPTLRAKSSAMSIQRYAESEEDADYSDIVFDKDATATQKSESDYESDDGTKGTLMLNSRLSTGSWLGDEDDEDDPFASVEGFDEMDLQANIARDKHARLQTSVTNLVSSLKTTQAEDVLSDLSAELLDVLEESEDAKAMIISAHGMLPILEILEPCTLKSKQGMVLRLLKAVNFIIANDVEIQENLCFVGGIPVITKFTARQYAYEIRHEAAFFVRQMFQTSTLTLQMFVSAGGLNILTEFLDEDYEDAPGLVLIGVDGIWNVFELQGPTPKNDFCRILSRSRVLSPLALVLENVLDEGDDRSIALEGRIVGIFYFFSQAEKYVQEAVADHVVLKRVLKGLPRMTPTHQITMLKFIKNLSGQTTTLESLHAANAIELLIDLLSANLKKSTPHFREISNQVINTMYNLCKLSKVRQEDAAANGVIPLLMKIMRGERPPKEFALPILCDMAHAGKIGRKYLWQNKGLQFYVSLLDDTYWQTTALDAIFVWLQEETARVEECLLASPFTEEIVACFTQPRPQEFDWNLLEPLQKLLRLSSPVALSLAQPAMFTGILNKLQHKKAVVRLNLLRIVRSICDPLNDSEDNEIRLHPLFSAIQELADSDEAVLVRNMACELVKSNNERLTPEHRLMVRGSGSRARSSHSSSSRGSVSRRQSSYTPNNIPHASNTPLTPTHGSRLSLAATSHTALNSAFLEGSVTPRRLGGHLLPREGVNGGLHRPRSREGPPGTAKHDARTTVSHLSMPRRTSADTMIHGAPSSTKSSMSKSRLPRTSMLRSSRSSIASMSTTNPGNENLSLSAAMSGLSVHDPEPGRKDEIRRISPTTAATTPTHPRYKERTTASRNRERPEPPERGKSMSAATAAAGKADKPNARDTPPLRLPLNGGIGRRRNRVPSEDFTWS